MIKPGKFGMAKKEVTKAQKTVGQLWIDKEHNGDLGFIFSYVEFMD